MTYIPVNKANTNHKSRDENGREIARYSRYETGIVAGKNREVLAVIADKAGFDGMGFDASIGSGDDSWHVANVFTSDRRYIDTMVIGGAFDSLHAKQVADSQLHRLRGDNCVIVTNPQFDSLSDDKPDTWSIDAINKLLANPSQNKNFLPVITAQELNVEAARVTFDAVQWDSMDGLVSHNGSDTALFLDLIRADGHKQLLEPLNLVRELELLGAEEHSFDALMDTKNRLSLMKDRLFNAMSRNGDAELSVTNVTETKPFKRQGVTNIAFVFELSDGQKLSIWFHNPDSTPSQLKADDVMISWKWMLNKRDVTAVLSPKQGDNVQIPVLAARIMRVARKNSKKFAATQARAAELEKELQDAQTLVEVKQGEIDQLDTDISGLNAAIDAAMAKKAEEPTTPPEMTAKEQKEQRERERVLAMQFEEVTQFYKNNGAEPNRYANDIIEKMLAKRLEAIRANAEFVEYLAPYDTYNLLNDEPAPDVLSNSANNEVPPFSVGDPVVWRNDGGEMKGIYKSYNATNHSIAIDTDDGQMNAPANEVSIDHDGEAVAPQIGNFKVGDPVVWRNEIGEMKGTFRGMVGQNIFIMTDDGQMGAPATEVFADDSAPARVSVPAMTENKIDKLKTKMEDINDFYEKNDKAPSITSMLTSERILAEWLDEFRAADEAVLAIVRPLDTYSLIDGSFEESTAPEATPAVKNAHYFSSDEDFKALVQEFGLTLNPNDADSYERNDDFNSMFWLKLVNNSVIAGYLLDKTNNRTTTRELADFDDFTISAKSFFKQYQAGLKNLAKVADNKNSPKKTVAIRDALDVLKNDVFKGQTDKVFMYTLNDAGDMVHSSLIKASSKSAQSRFTNKHLYEAGVKTVMTSTIPDNVQNAAAQLEYMGYTIDYADPEGFTSDDYTVGDVYEMKRKDVFGQNASAPDDTIIMEFREWRGLRRGEDEAQLMLSTLSGSNGINLTVAKMDAIVSRGDARRLMQPEIDATREFEDTKLISTYVNNKGRVLAEVFLQEGVYDIKSSDGSSIGLADVGQVTEKLKAIKSRNASMKYQSGQDFLRDDGGKTYPPVEYDEEEREYIAYMNNKKIDKWTAYQISGGGWGVVADNAQARAFNSWNPKYFDTVDQLLAAYPAFKGIKALIAQAEQDDYESIDSSKYPEMFLTRHADKLQTLGVTDNDIQYRHDDTSDKLYVEEGIFKDKTLNYTDAVCNVVDAAISLYADAAVSDFNATAYQDSLFDSLTSQSKPTYGVTVQIVKFDATVRAKIDIDGDCEILQGASGEDVVATIKHKFIDNQAAYIDAIESAFKAQSDKKAADDAAAAQADIDTKEAENMKNTNTKNSTLSTAERQALAKLGVVNYNFKNDTLASGAISDVDKRKIAYEFMDVLEKQYGFSVGYKGRDFETIHISQMGFKTTIQTSFIVPFNQQDIDDIVNAYREYKKEQAAAGQKEWWETTRASTSVYLIGDTLNDDYVRIKNRDGEIANNGDAFTYDYSVLIKGQGFEYGEDGSLAEIQAFVKEKTQDKGELRLVKGADVLAMNPQADDNDLTNAPASDDNSNLIAHLDDFESAVNAESFNPADFDTTAFIELVNATADDAELTARVMAISSVYQQKLVAASMAAMTSLAGGA